MKTIILWAITFIVLVFAAALGCPAQSIDNESVSVTFSGETASVTLKSVSATRAINELVDQSVNTKASTVIIAGIWEVSYDATGYTPKLKGTAIEGSPFKAKADACKALKTKMKGYYALNGTLN